MRFKNATSWKLAGMSALALGVLAVPAQQAAAGVIADYDFQATLLTDRPKSIDSDANSTAGDMQAVGSDTGFSGAGNAFMRSQSLAGTDEAAAITAEEYFSFTVTPDSGYELDLTSLTFTSIHNQTAVDITAANEDATMNFFVRSSVDSYASTVGSVFSEAWNGTTGRSIDLSGAAFQDLVSAVTFRLYVYENPAVDTIQGARWDDVVLNGSVALVPEPGSLALMGLGGLCVLVRRRRDA